MGWIASQSKVSRFSSPESPTVCLSLLLATTKTMVKTAEASQREAPMKARAAESRPPHLISPGFQNRKKKTGWHHSGSLQFRRTYIPDQVATPAARTESIDEIKSSVLFWRQHQRSCCIIMETKPMKKMPINLYASKNAMICASCEAISH